MPHKAAGREPHGTRFDLDLAVAVKRLSKIHKRKITGTLIDVGCANGAFMAAADTAGYVVQGVDLAKEAVKPELRHLVRCGELNHVGFQRRFADIITFNDSFEHFVDPLSALKAANGILKRDGLLVIDIPDMGCDDAIDQGSAFKHVKPHEHLWYFTATQLRDLLQANGFTVIDMEVPVPGKVTAYASPEVTVSEIEVHGPPGVGDTLWTLQKLKPIWENEYPCRIRYVICSSGDQKIVTRAKDFLLLCPYISSVDFKNLDGQPLPRDVGCADPSNPLYELFPNNYLEPQGFYIENWRPELGNDWEMPFQVPEAAMEQARLRLRQYGKYVTVYMSSHVWNWTVSEPHWTPAHWAETLIKVNDAGLKPVILGAGADAEYADAVAEEIVKMRYVPSQVMVNTIGKTSLPLAMAYMQLASITVGVANGLPMLPLYTGGKAIIFWPTRGISQTKTLWCEEFRRNWLPPHIRNSGRYTDLVIGQFTAQDLYEEITGRTKQCEYGLIHGIQRLLPVLLLAMSTACRMI